MATMLKMKITKEARCAIEVAARKELNIVMNK